MYQFSRSLVNIQLFFHHFFFGSQFVVLAPMGSPPQAQNKSPARTSSLRTPIVYLAVCFRVHIIFWFGNGKSTTLVIPSGYLPSSRYW
jgi:hypothetical protein